MIIGQITDLHIAPPGHRVEKRYRTAWHLERAVAHIQALPYRPDVLLLTGDLVEEGTAAEYERLLTLLAPLSMPLYAIPGNHDTRNGLRAAFASPTVGHGEFVQYTVEDYPVRLVALDTLIPGETGGELCAPRLDWLDARLAEAPEAPTMILMHHPPFLTGLGAMDRNGTGLGLKGADQLGAIVARHRQIERIVSGHIHRPICMSWHGTTASVAPSTAHQIALDLGNGAIPTIMEPPALQLHVWMPGHGLVTHTSYIGDYPALPPE
jgi:Icc protein